jgi:hypothetical protein
VGRLRVTDDFLRAYLLRPELRPAPDTEANEARVHASLLDEPRRVVDVAEVDAIEDPNARSNYRVWLDFRTRLLDAESLEGCYRGLFDSEIRTPPLFIDQLVQIILRNILDGVDDAMEARAAELFYRAQRANLDEGRILLADLETVDLRASGGAYGSLGRLLVQAQALLPAVNLDVLDAGNAHSYWSRDQRHDFVIGIHYGQAALAAFCRVMARWVQHFLGVTVRIEPTRAIQDERWAWHVGLDAQSTAVLNDLWHGEEVDGGRLARLLALFRLEFANQSDARADLAERPVYMALSMDEESVVRMKPQNLLLNLPLASRV